jgi:sugar lactone lactonase YvrE
VCVRWLPTLTASLLLSLGAVACGGAGSGADGGAIRGEGGNGGGTTAADGGAITGSCNSPPTADSTPASGPDSVAFLANVTVSTLAGGATPGTANGPPGVGQLDNPVSVAIEPSGSIAISDFDNDRLRRMAGDGTLSALTMQSNFTRPFGLVVTGGVLYAQTDNDPDGQRSTTSGTIWRIDSATGAAAVAGANLGRPRSFAALSDGRLVLADYQNQRIRIFDPTSGSVSDLAGAPGCPGSANGTGADARFTDPRGIAVLPGDRIIVADRSVHILREVSPAGVVITFAGDGVAGTVDGPLRAARFNMPAALAVDAAGDLFVSDYGAQRIRRIAADGTVTTVAGDGKGGFMDGAGATAEFFGQEGIAVSPDGATIYVADGTLGGEPPGPYHRIRKITIGP